MTQGLAIDLHSKSFDDHWFKELSLENDHWVSLHKIKIYTLPFGGGGAKGAFWVTPYQTNKALTLSISGFCETLLLLLFNILNSNIDHLKKFNFTKSFKVLYHIEILFKMS